MPVSIPYAVPAGIRVRVMNRVRRWLRSPAAGRDVLGSYRDRIMLPMAVASTALVLPFAIFDFFAGKRLLAAVAFAVLLPLAVDAHALWRKRKPPIAYGWILLPVAAAISLALVERGMHGALWCYPAILFCYFVLPGWQATAGAVGLLTLTSVLVAEVIDLGTMWRFAVTAGLSIIILNIILGVVGELQRKLYEQATTDPLTGALNRRQLGTTLADAIEHSRRGESPVSLLAFDLDHFKRINDGHGHAAGDAVLQRVVTLVQERARRIDRLFRMGGEEFALLLPDNNVADAMRVATMLRERIQGAGWPPGIEVTISVGVAQLHRKHDVDSWLKASDDALYRAKADGRNCVRIASRGRGVVIDPADAAMTRPSELTPLDR